MRAFFQKHTQYAALICVLMTRAMVGAETATPLLLQSESGTITFETATNMPGIEVKGKSSALSAHVEVSREESKLVLRQVDASVAVNSLATGMKMRDEHMRKFIFKTADGREPDLHFTGPEATCDKNPGAHEFVCPIEGALSLRGVAKPLTLVLHAKEQNGNSEIFRAVGDALIKLSDYGIPAPSQFGVKPSNEVRHPPQSGWLDELGRLKGGRAIGLGVARCAPIS